MGYFENKITFAKWDATFDYLYTNLGAIYLGN